MRVALPPGLTYACDFVVELTAPHEMGVSPAGTRRIIPIVGGTVRGPLLNGALLDIGADWQTVQTGGLAQLDARYALRTDDGAVIEIISTGMRHAPRETNDRIRAGEEVPPTDYYMRTFVRLETGDERYAWVNRALFLASGGKIGATVRLSVYRVD